MSFNRFLPDRVETVPQLLARPAQARLDRAGREVERGGDLRVRELRPRVEEQDLALVAPQLRKRGASSRVSSAGASSAETDRRRCARRRGASAAPSASGGA